MDDQNSESIETFISGVLQEKPQRFSCKQLKDYSSNFKHQVAHGEFANVYKGSIGAMEVVIKVQKHDLNCVMENQFIAELSAISKLSHINIIKLIGFCSDENMKAFVYESTENGSLDKVLQGKDSTLSWEKLYAIVVGTGKGLSYLHEQSNEGIIHCDISPKNVVLDKNFSPKIANFGFAKHYDEDTSEILRATRTYDAPEVRNGVKLTNKCDVFSFGMMLFDVLNRRKYGREDQFCPRKVWVKFEQGKLDGLMKECGIKEKDKESGKTLVTVALWCTQYKPEDRPSMSTVVKALEMGIHLPVPPKPFFMDDITSSLGDLGKASGSTKPTT